jgi:methionyl-tRNA formyltransferase
MVLEKPRILFMGTPEFAVPSLQRLIEDGYPIIAVVTQPDRPRGRGRKTEPSPVKKTAEAQRIPVLQPLRVRDPAFLIRFRELEPDMVVLVAFGQILPPEIIDSPPMGCLNVHPSLLPLYRGAAPINWTLIRGEDRTGITIMRMDEGLDSGDVLLQEECIIKPEDNFDTLHDRLAHQGAALLLKTIEGIMYGTITRASQNHALATYAPRLKKGDGHIDWVADATDIVNRIRGLSSTPGAYTFVKGKQLKIFSAGSDKTSVSLPPGSIGPSSPQGLAVTAKNGIVYLKEVQLEGKKRMKIQDFLAGFRISPGDLLT